MWTEYIYAPSASHAEAWSAIHHRRGDKPMTADEALADVKSFGAISPAAGNLYRVEVSDVLAKAKRMLPKLPAKLAFEGHILSPDLPFNLLEFRCPRKGEWYVSGAIPEAWKTPADLDCPHWIVEPIKQTPMRKYHISAWARSKGAIGNYYAVEHDAALVSPRHEDAIAALRLAGYETHHIKSVIPLSVE